MYYIISLVVVAIVVTVGAAGLFGRRRPGLAPGLSPNFGATSGPGSRPVPVHRPPPAYRIVQPGRDQPGSSVRAVPAGVPAGPVGVHEGGTGIMPAMLRDEDDGRRGPDPDAVLLARSHAPTGSGRPDRRR